MQFSEYTHNIIKLALEEDIGSGDITTNALIPDNDKTTAYITAKEPLVLAGIDVAHTIFQHLDPDIELNSFYKDGDIIKNNEDILKITGGTRALLSGERTALNFLQRLCGIATLTAQYVDKIKGYKAEIIDTRKTTPVYRELEKYAVRCGGGKNHRFGLFDMALIKDNHIKACPGIQYSVEVIKKEIDGDKKIEIEVKDMKELKEALECDVDIIMLDNMKPDDLKKAVKRVNGKVRLEASGGITLKNIVRVASSGVDLISIGELTHSAKSADISMNIAISSATKTLRHKG